MNRTIIVVGLSAASMAFITKLRSFDKNSKIIAFTKEKDFPYNRCLLADFLVDEIDVEGIRLKPLNFFEENNIEVYFGRVVTKIDALEKQVWVENETYRYDYLFLGIGTRPFIPQAFENQKIDGVFTFHTMQDMNLIHAFIETNKPKSAVVIGGGLNGIEAASSLISKGLAVAVVEYQASMLPGQVDDQSALWIENIMRKKSIMIVNNHKVINYIQDADNRLNGVKLDSGASIRADMVVIAAGSKLNSELLKDAGIALENGSILVDQHMQTNIPSILAGGDICLVPDIISKQKVRSTTWSDAMLQGLSAATTLGQAPRAYPGMIGIRDSYFFGKDFYACGQTSQVAHFEKNIKQTNEALEAIFTQDGLIKGFVLIGDISRLSELKRDYLLQKKL